MKQQITFFIIVSLAASLAHKLILLCVVKVGMMYGTGAWLYWVFTAPMNFLLRSSFGHTLSPMTYAVLETTNSFLWGFVVGAVILWRRFR